MSFPPDLPTYAELHCLSNFSFQRGASHPHELVAPGAGVCAARAGRAGAMAAFEPGDTGLSSPFEPASRGLCSHARPAHSFSAH